MTTYEDDVEVRRASVGTKVLIFAILILAALGSFWGVVWFIRSYVEPPRVMLPAPILTLAARESTPVPPPPRNPERVATPAPTGTVAAEAKPREAVVPFTLAQPAPPAPTPARQVAEPSASRSVADRWGPMSQSAAPAPPPSPPAPPPTAVVAAVPLPAALPAEPPPIVAPAPPPPAVPAAVVRTAPVVAVPPAPAAGTTDSEPQDIAAGSVPAIEGPAPLPRRKPAQTAAVKRLDPPLPRPRPDGPAPQSVWTAVPTSDDRFPQP